MTIWYVEAIDAYEESGVQNLHGPYKKYKKAQKKAVKLVDKYDFCNIYSHTNKGFGKPIPVHIKTEVVFKDYPREHNIHGVYVDNEIIKEEEEIKYSCGWPDSYYVKWHLGEGSNKWIQFLNNTGGELIKRDPNAHTVPGTIW